MKEITEGKVVKLVRHRGFGFLNTDDYDDDVFFHHSELEKDVYFDDLSVGDKMEFDVEHTDKGPEAKSVSLIGGGGTKEAKPVEEAPIGEHQFDEEDLGW